MRVHSPENTVEHYVQTFEMARFLNDHLLENLQVFRFPIYASIFMEQEEQHYLYFLVEGQVQCSHYHLNGKLAVLAVSEPFSAIGDVEILTETPIHSNVIATRDVTLLGLERTVIERYGANDPRFLRFIIDQLREKLYKTNLLQMTQVLPLINRLAVYLLAQAAANPDSTSFILPDKEDLASLMGATPRHLNRVLREMIDNGMISETYPHVHILKRDALEALTV